MNVGLVENGLCRELPARSNRKPESQNYKLASPTRNCFPASVGGNGSVHGEPVKMIEPLRIRPCGKMFFAQLHEFFLKIGDGLRRVRIARGHHATLAGIVAEKFHRADLKRFEFIRRAEQPVFAKRLAVR